MYVSYVDLVWARKWAGPESFRTLFVVSSGEGPNHYEGTLFKLTHWNLIKPKHAHFYAWIGAISLAQNNCL